MSAPTTANNRHRQNALVESAVRAAFRAFRAALLDVSDDPTPANVARYLAASHELEVLSKSSSEAG